MDQQCPLSALWVILWGKAEDASLFGVLWHVLLAVEDESSCRMCPRLWLSEHGWVFYTDRMGHFWNNQILLLPANFYLLNHWLSYNSVVSGKTSDSLDFHSYCPCWKAFQITISEAVLELVCRTLVLSQGNYHTVKSPSWSGKAWCMFKWLCHCPCFLYFPHVQSLLGVCQNGGSITLFEVI